MISLLVVQLCVWPCGNALSPLEVCDGAPLTPMRCNRSRVYREAHLLVCCL